METVVWPVNTLVTHRWSHPDECAAILWLRLFGEARYPGVSKAGVLYVDAGSRPEDSPAFKDRQDWNWQDLLAQGYVSIGVFGGPYDEHPYWGVRRKQGESAASLVAKDLGIAGDPAVAYVNKYVTSNDLHGKANPFEFASLLKAMHFAHRDEPSKVMKFAMAALQAKYAEQQGFQQAIRELAQVDIREIRGARRMLRVAIVKSDGQLINRAAFSSRGNLNIDLLVQAKTSGHVQIYTSAASGINIVPIVRAIRTSERGFKGISVGVNDATLVSEGRFVPGAEEWAYIEAGQMILNGSLSATNLPPTKIPFGNLVAIVLRELPRCPSRPVPVKLFGGPKLPTRPASVVHTK